jgi:hypothetical protein
VNAIVRIVVGISIIFTYPMVCYPCRLSLHNLLIDIWKLIRFLSDEFLAIELPEFQPKPPTTVGDEEMTLSKRT